jgi:hypothetical protein
MANSLIAGVLALCWLLLRTGTKPSRFTYPCQQAAWSAATLAFGVPLVAALVAARRRVVTVLCTPTGIAFASLGLLATAGIWAYSSRADSYGGPRLDPRGDYRAQLFHVTDCLQDPVGDRFVGLDNLLLTMAREGLKFYQSPTESLLAGPDGIIAADDVVIVKINYQWDQRGGTNTDVLRGLIRRIVDHPDGFVGEVAVCENAQFASTSGFNRSENNAQDHGLSPYDVVVGFRDLGYTVSHYDWTLVRSVSVTEYSTGNMADGYVVYPYDAQFGGRVSYPKFQTYYGTYISLRDGIWDPDGEVYDREHLKFINVPVLKSHHSTYGVTACVKHYMGVVTGSLSTNSHSAIRYGILGALMGEIQLADLHILDGIWINANPFSGPSTSYGGATRRDELLASLDPIATDIWATKNILIPAFIANGYSPPWPSPSADPDDPSSDFRVYLDNSMSQILSAGYDATNDLDQIDVFDWNGAGDFNGDGDVDNDDFLQFGACFTGPGGQPEPGCEPGDFDGDEDIDCYDWEGFQLAWTEPTDPPPLPDCDLIPETPLPEDSLAIPCMYDEQCPEEAACIDNVCYAPKNRYISIARNPAQVANTARRITLQGGGAGPWWVGPPTYDVLEDMYFASVSPTSVYAGDGDADWVDGDWPDLVHLKGCEIAPGHTYEVQAIAHGNDESDELNYSQPLALKTASVWGDIVSTCEFDQCLPPEGDEFQPTIDDVLAVVNAFTGIRNAPLTWMDVDPVVGDGQPEGMWALIGDVLAVVNVFSGEQYPGNGPLGCP